MLSCAQAFLNGLWVRSPGDFDCLHGLPSSGPIHQGRHRITVRPPPRTGMSSFDTVRHLITIEGLTQLLYVWSEVKTQVGLLQSWEIVHDENFKRFGGHSLFA